MIFNFASIIADVVQPFGYLYFFFQIIDDKYRPTTMNGNNNRSKYRVLLDSMLLLRSLTGDEKQRALV